MNGNGVSAPSITYLTTTDAGACYQLSAAAGWNQTVHDWDYLICAGNARCVRAGAGAPVATTVVLPYPPAFAWMGMVLVAPAYRRRGYAQALMTDALRYAETAGLPPALDATPMGRPLYAKLGFVEVCEMTRWRREAGLPNGAGAPGRPAAAAENAEPAPGGFRPCTSLQEAIRRDAAAAGCERAALFEDFRHRDGTAMWCGPGDTVAVLRRGRAAWQVGPVVAGAGALNGALSLAIAHSGAAALVVDSFDENEAAAAALSRAGFSRVRTFTRMVYGAAAFPWSLESVAAVAGPEYG